MKGFRDLRRALFPTKKTPRQNNSGSVVPSSTPSSPTALSPQVDSIWQAVESIQPVGQRVDDDDGLDGTAVSDPVLLRTASTPCVKSSPPRSLAIPMPLRLRSDSAGQLSGSPHLRSISNIDGTLNPSEERATSEFADLTPALSSSIKSQHRRTSNGPIATDVLLDLDLERDPDLNHSPTKSRPRTNSTLRRKLRRLSRKSIELSEKLDAMFLSNGQESELSKKHPLHKAAEEGDVQTLKQLVTILNTDANFKDPKDGSTALHKAAAANQVGAMEFLISSGAQVQITDYLKSTPLHWACNKGNDDAAVLLISKGAEINVRDKYGYSPLHLALKQSHTRVAQSLLLFGGSIDFKRYDGKTPIHLACERGNLEMVEFLIERGAKANLKDEFGETCVFAAANNGHLNVIRYLLFHRDGVVNVKMLRDPSGQNLIHRAARTGCKELVDIMKELLTTSEDNSDEECPAFTELINELDNVLWCSPLHVAVQHNSIAVIDRLISLGADVNAVDRSGDTPLHLAAKKGSTEICGILCQAGATLTIKNKEKKSPRSILKKKGIALPHKGT